MENNYHYNNRTIASSSASTALSPRAVTDDDHQVDHQHIVFLYNLQITTGTISFLASLIMVITIQLSIRRSYSTPYRRLVCGLCLSDILQSLAILTGPFATPTGTSNAPWARGTTASCNLNGFMLSAGYTAVTMYVLSLSVYYLCRLRKKMSHEGFRVKMERKMHRFIIVWNFVVNLSLAVTHHFNAKSGGGLCFVTEYPAGCDVAPEVYGSCQRGHNAKRLLFVFVFVPWLICFVGICYCMVRLVQHAFALSRVTLWHAGGAGGVGARSHARSCHDAAAVSDGEGGELGDDTQVSGSISSMSRNSRMRSSVEDGNHRAAAVSCDENLIQLSLRYKREMTTQAMSFIGVFFFVYFMPIVRFVYNLKRVPFPFPLLVLYSFCFPLGGLLNILVHTRPHIAELRRRRTRQRIIRQEHGGKQDVKDEKISWMRAFVNVLMAGGDILDLKEEDDDERKESIKHDSSDQDEDGEKCDEEGRQGGGDEKGDLRTKQPIISSDRGQVVDDLHNAVIVPGQHGRPDGTTLPRHATSYPSVSYDASDQAVEFPSQRFPVVLRDEEDEFVKRFQSRVKGEARP